MTAIRQAERTATLEAKVNQMHSDITDLDKKLDDLLALRNKGVGAFWLASMLFGTGIVGAFSLMISWLKGHVL